MVGGGGGLGRLGEVRFAKSLKSLQQCVGLGPYPLLGGSGDLVGRLGFRVWALGFMV